MVGEGQRDLYGQLCKKLKEVERLAGIQGLLSWDEQVKSKKTKHDVFIPSNALFFIPTYVREFGIRLLRRLLRGGSEGVCFCVVDSFPADD